MTAKNMTDEPIKTTDVNLVVGKPQRLLTQAYLLAQVFDDMDGVLVVGVSAIPLDAESSRVSITWADGSRYSFKITEWLAPTDEREAEAST